MTYTKSVLMLEKPLPKNRRETEHTVSLSFNFCSAVTGCHCHCHCHRHCNNTLFQRFMHQPLLHNGLPTVDSIPIQCLMHDELTNNKNPTLKKEATCTWSSTGIPINRRHNAPNLHTSTPKKPKGTKRARLYRLCTSYSFDLLVL